MLGTILCIVFTLVLGLAIVLLFDMLNFEHEKPKIGKRKNKKNPLMTSGPQSLESTVRHYQGKKDFFMVQEISNAKTILKNTRRTNEFQKTLTTCVVLACGGCVAGLILKNPFIIPVLAIGLFMIPLWKLKMYQSKYKKYLAMQLESGVSLITSAYMRSDNLLEAVEENITNISDLIRPDFEEFLAEYKVDPNMKNCLRSLQSKVNDSIFKEWCDGLIKSYSNSEMKETLMGIVEKYSAVRIVQDELDAETASALVEYIIMLGVLFMVYPLVRMLNVDWFAAYFTTAGKGIVTFSLCVALYAIKKLIDLTTPVQFER